MAFSRAMLMVSVLALVGCHSNLYSTPRTVPRGQSQHMVALDLDVIPEQDVPLPAMVYLARIGLADRVDLGLQASSTFKLDLKVNPVRTRYFDLAIDPAVSFGYILSYYGGPIFSAAMPVMMGFNLHESVTLMMQGGAGYALAGFGRVYGFGGAGVQIRASDLVMVQPEVTIQVFQDGSVWPCFGLGFGFGRQPSYKTKQPGQQVEPSNPAAQQSPTSGN